VLTTQDELDAGHAALLSDEELGGRIHLLLNSFMRRAPCQPARSQQDVDCVYQALCAMGVQRPDRGDLVARPLKALPRECVIEDLRYPGTH
jgi:hypothetical protein